MNKKESLIKAIVIIIVIILSVLLLVCIMDIVIVEKSHQKVESTMIIIEAQEKQTSTTLITQTVKPITYYIKYTYYIIDGDIKVEVTSNAYKDIDIGDKICIIKNVYIDDRTNKIVKTTYTYNN